MMEGQGGSRESKKIVAVRVQEGWREVPPKFIGGQWGRGPLVAVAADHHGVGSGFRVCRVC